MLTFSKTQVIERKQELSGPLRTSQGRCITMTQSQLETILDENHSEAAAQDSPKAAEKLNVETQEKDLKKFAANESQSPKSFSEETSTGFKSDATFSADQGKAKVDCSCGFLFTKVFRRTRKK